MLYYDWNIGDWRRSTRTLNPLEKGWYREMIDELRDQEKPLPLDENALFELMGAVTAKDQAAIRNVLKKKWTEYEGGWIQKRSWADILMYNEMRHKKAEAGREGGRSKHRRLLEQKLAGAKQVLESALAEAGTLVNQKPVTSNQEPETKTPAVPAGAAGARSGCVSVSEWSELIKGAYPRNDSPMDCLAVIRGELDRGQDPGAMLEKVRACGEAAAAAPGGASNRYVPKALSFFTQSLWIDHEAFRLRWEGSEKKEGGSLRDGRNFDKPTVATVVKTHARLPEPPCDWRAVLRDLYPKEQFPQADYDEAWGLYEPDIRREVECECRKRGLLPAEWSQPRVPDEAA